MKKNDSIIAKILKDVKFDKKTLIMNIPFILVGWAVNKASWLWHTIPKGDDKMLLFINGLKTIFGWPIISFGIVDLALGIAAGVLFKILMTEKRKNAKQFRHGTEYGGARWGTREEIKHYMSDNPRENLILTQTEGLTMGKPEAPKYALNKNVLVIGGSGSGKTRFFVKPNIMQMHSSYCVTDPKGTILVECGKMLAKGPYALDKDGNKIPLKDKNGKILKTKSGHIRYKREPYKIKVLNTINFEKSLHYNPFAYISKKHPEKDIIKLVNTIMVNTKGEGNQSGEFANIGQIPKFEKLIATIRSREISACIILQAKSQLKATYKDNADTIEGNCVRPDVASAI